jgi:hypothetical protein
MSNEKIKHYKNPARNNDGSEVITPYVPQYKLMQMTPEKQEKTKLPSGVLIARGSSPDLNNSRTRKIAITQPYAEIVSDNTPYIGNQIPNVGNNMEQTWSYIDGEMIDDISGEVVGALDNQPMIDNNDIIDNQQVFESPTESIKTFMNESNNDLSLLKDNSYILIVGGNIISISDMQSIQEEASKLVFGEHELCAGESIPIEDIVILKKVNIKVGLFLE